MEVILAEHAGFCFGVKRAVELLEQEITEHGGELPIYTWGPIIHNEEVVREFAAKGVRVLESKEQLADAAGKGTVVIRAHGVPQETERQIRENGFDVIDATCPFVKRIHGIVQDAAAEGQRIIVVGDPGHPEVQGIVSRAGGHTASNVCVVETAEEARQIGFPAGSRVTVVAQTTFHVNKFQEIVAIIKTKEYDVNIAATICSATDERQKEAAELAA
nr:4-hydroxy-3-methylbut-2-enyl diphosphate reductase [Lachnospiraceae bacterium]